MFSSLWRTSECAAPSPSRVGQERTRTPLPARCLGAVAGICNHCDADMAEQLRERFKYGAYWFWLATPSSPPHTLAEPFRPPPSHCCPMHTCCSPTSLGGHHSLPPHPVPAMQPICMEPCVVLGPFTVAALSSAQHCGVQPKWPKTAAFCTTHRLAHARTNPPPLPTTPHQAHLTVTPNN